MDRTTPHPRHWEVYRLRQRGIDPALAPFYRRVRHLIGGTGLARSSAVAITRWVQDHPPPWPEAVLAVWPAGSERHIGWWNVHDGPYLVTRHTAAILIPAAWVGGR